jgi:hypothetical protein
VFDRLGVALFIVTFFTNALHRENIHVTPADYIDIVSRENKPNQR